MKQDPYFKYVAAAFITGVLLALFSPPSHPIPSPRVPTVTTVTHATTTPARS